MKAKDRDPSTDELLKRLQQSLEDDADADGTPEDVFSDRSTSVKKQEDDDIAAFDSYMAQLLGELEDSEEIQRADKKKSARSRRRNVADAPMHAAITHAKDEEAELTDEEEADELLSDAGQVESSYTPVYDAEELPEEAIPVPDTRVELSGDVIEDEVDETMSDEPAETEEITAQFEAEPASKPNEMEIAAEPFEVLEQLTITEPERESIPESADDACESTKEAEETFEEPTEIGDHRPAYEFSDESDEPDEPEDVGVFGAAVKFGKTEEDMLAEPTEDEREAATDTSEQEPEIAPVVLREGDLLLDEDDDIPLPDQLSVPLGTIPTAAPTAAPAAEPQAVPTPVASPLDAARESHSAQKAPLETPRPKQSPLDAMTARAQGNVSPIGGMAAFGNRQKSERSLSDDDIELLLDLGYDSNLTQKVGSQRVETVRYRRQDDERARRALRHVYGCSGEEYSSHAQDKQIRATYRMQTRGAVARLVLTVLVALLLLASDLFPLWRDQLGDLAAAVPNSGAWGLVGIVLLALGTLLVRSALSRGLKALVRFSPIPASFPLLMLVCTALYDFAMLFSPTCGTLLNFPVGAAFVLLSIAELMAVKQESMTFGVVSARSRKIVMEPISPRKKKVVRDGHIVKIINDDGGRRAWRVRPTDQVAGYFRRSGAYTQRYRGLSGLLAIAVLAAILVGVLTLVVTAKLTAAATALLLTLQMAMPAAALISFAYPMLLATRRLTPQGCAIVGQSSVDEYAGEKTLLFDDTEMFRSKSSTEISIKGSGDTKKYIRYAKRLFSTLGGTLRGISTSDLTSETYEERVEILKLYDQGVEARIDGKVTVMAGTSAHMVRHGIRVPGESAELLVRRSVESCILYLAFDGKLRLGYEVDYRISGRFEQVVEELARAGTAVAIETCDPSIHDDFLTRSRRAGSAPITVLKPVRFERKTDSLLCDSGVIATRSARDIAAATFACDRLMDNDKQLAHFHHIATLFGAVLALALSLLGLVSVSATLIAALVQLLWCIPTVMLSRKNLINEQSSENGNVNRNRE